jgi:hypothetical protein
MKLRSCSMAVMLGLMLASCASEVCLSGSSDESCQTDPGVSSAGLAAGACERGSTQPCTSFVTSSGSALTLGRLGAVMEKNVGRGFENVVSESDTSTLCDVFIAAFGADPVEAEEWLDIGDLNLALYTVYRPANWRAGERYPIVTWGNGTCMQPETYGALLRYVASQGFFVVAANSRFVGSGAEQRRALDYALAANNDRRSPYFRRLDTSRIAAIGHSQGGLGTVNASSDARVDTTAIFNAGSSSASKPFLLFSGDRDISGADASALAAVVNAAPRAAYLYYHMIPGTSSLDGYLTLIMQPERVTEPTAAWLKYQLNGDAASRRWFVGRNCQLCNRAAEFEYGQHGLN